MNFRDLELGFADAEKEFTRIPNYFGNIFYDPQCTLNKLINGWEFLLIGRKGVGKSAYSSKIRSMTDQGIQTYHLPLNDFEYSTFEKTCTDKNITGTQKFKASWDFVLLLIIYKGLYNIMNISESDELNKATTLLGRLNFSIEKTYKQQITSLSKLKLGTNIGIFDIEFEKEFGTKPTSFIERIGSLNDYLLEVLKDISLNGQKLFILIDGVDDILRYKKNQLDILSCLVRSVDYINDKLSSLESKIKIILFIREDILINITDTDINKIKRDSSNILNWSDRTQDLKEIIKLRIKYSGVSEDELYNYIENMFPRKIREKNAWDYILDFTLYKPRDVIQFFKCCQELYGNNSMLSYSEMQSVIKYYSREYFIEEMKNELAGFSKDSLINIVPTVFKKLNNRGFSLLLFTRIMKEQTITNDFTDEDIKYLLYLLFEAGYIGQLHQTGTRSRKSVQFKYRNPSAKIDYSYEFIIHKGLFSGLGIRI